MEYEITITYNDNSNRVLSKQTKPTAGTFWSLLSNLETRKIKSFNIALSK